MTDSYRTYSTCHAPITQHRSTSSTRSKITPSRSTAIQVSPFFPPPLSTPKHPFSNSTRSVAPGLAAVSVRRRVPPSSTNNRSAGSSSCRSVHTLDTISSSRMLHQPCDAARCDRRSVSDDALPKRIKSTFQHFRNRSPSADRSFSFLVSNSHTPLTPRTTPLPTAATALPP